MKLKFAILILISPFSQALLMAQGARKSVEPSYFKLTTANGLIVAAYNIKENRVDNVYPHLFANYDSGRYVYPFAGNVSLNSSEKPVNEAIFFRNN